MLNRLLLPAAALLLIAAAPAPNLPNAYRTPGTIDPAITQANIGKTICNRAWSTRYIRPPEDYTYNLKRISPAPGAIATAARAIMRKIT